MKKSLYFFKWPLVLLLVGFMVRVIGAMIKILHWANADTILLAGTVMIVISIAWLIIKLIALKKQNV